MHEGSVSDTPSTSPKATRGRTLDRLASIDRRAFELRFTTPRVPVVIRVTSEAFAPLTWSPEYLAEALSTRSVHLGISPTETFDFDRETHAIRFTGQAMSFPEAIARICAPEIIGGTHHYLLQHNVVGDFPEIAASLRSPMGLLDGHPTFAGLWCGGAGNVTPLHYDEPNNLFVQCHGRKVFTLFAPDQTECLYPTSGTIDPFLSHLDVRRPDLDRFPKFASAEGIEVTLDAGDALYLPPYWWHAVRSVDTAVSVNFWWPPAFADLMAPTAMRRLPAMYRRDRLARYREAFSDNPTDGFMGLARRALRLRAPAVAVLFAGAALNEHVEAACAAKGVPFTSLESAHADLACAGIVDEAFAEVAAAHVALLRAAAEGRDDIDATAAARLVEDEAQFLARLSAPVARWSAVSRVMGA